MHYFIINQDIWMAHDQEFRRISFQESDKVPSQDISMAHVCVVDVDVMQAVAPEERTEQKDMVLAREFSAQFPGSYIIQDERIGTNQFQVVGVREERIREIYRLLPHEKVGTLIPYAMALRAYLTSQDLPAGRPIAFVDDLQGEILITFLDGLRFGTTRRFQDERLERILPEIKRSAISFSKTARKENGPYIVVTNNPEWGRKLSLLEPLQEVRVVASLYPAFEGLQAAQYPVKFELPEEVVKRTRQKQQRTQLPFYVASAFLAAFGVCLALFYQINFMIQDRACQHVERLRTVLEEKLAVVDREVYRSAIRQPKGINYGEIYFWIRSAVPSSYEINGLNFYTSGTRWVAQVDFILPKGADFEEIPTKSFMGKRWTIENILVKDRPGKSIRIEL